MHSEEARRQLDQINDVQLKPFGYELEYAGDSGSADFECAVTGISEKGTAHVALKKDSRGWRIARGAIVVKANSFT